MTHLLHKGTAKSCLAFLSSSHIISEGHSSPLESKRCRMQLSQAEFLALFIKRYIGQTGESSRQGLSIGDITKICGDFGPACNAGLPALTRRF